MDTTQTTKDTLLSEIKQLSKDRDVLRQVLDADKDLLAARKREIGELEQALVILDTKITSLSIDKETLEQKIADLTVTFNELSVCVGASTLEKKTLEDQITSSRNRLDDLTLKLAEAEQKSVWLEENLIKSNLQLTNTKEQEAAIIARRSLLDSDFVKKEKEYADRIIVLKDEVNKVSLELDSKKVKLDSLDFETQKRYYDELVASLTKKETEYKDKFNKSIQEFEMIRDRLISSIEEKKKELSTIEESHQNILVAQHTELQELEYQKTQQQRIIKELNAEIIKKQFKEYGATAC